MMIIIQHAICGPTRLLKELGYGNVDKRTKHSKPRLINIQLCPYQLPRDFTNGRPELLHARTHPKEIAPPIW